MTHTPTPTVIEEDRALIEEDRALIEALSRPMVRTALEAKALDYIRDGRGDDSEAVQLAAAHRELGERRAAGEARVVEWQPVATAPPACHVLAARFNADHGEWIYSVQFSPPIYPFTHWQPLPAPPAIERGDHRSKPA